MNSQLHIPPKEFQFLYQLNIAGVNYLVIGGYALKLYGCREHPQDLDLLVDRSRENAQKLYPVIVKALQSLGHRPDFTVEDLCAHHKHFRMPDKTIDILTSSPAIDFSSAFSRRVTVNENSLPVPIISIHDLILLKKGTLKNIRNPERRASENADIACLERKLPTVSH